MTPAAGDDNRLLEVRDLQKLFPIRRGFLRRVVGQVRAVDGVSFHVERGETAYDAAHREALEEIGVEGLALEFVTSMQRTRHADPIDERIDFFFTARTWTGEPRIVEPAKCAALAWFPLAALPSPVVAHERVVLDGLGTGVAGYTTFGF